MSDRHMGKAREIAGAFFAEHTVFHDQLAGSIATALAEAERESMKRAAEIAENIEDGASSYERHVHTEYWAGRDDASDIIAAAILSEAGIAVTD